MTKYEIHTNNFGDEIIVRNDGETVTSFMKDPANSDYQRYLRWLENPDADEAQSL